MPGTEEATGVKELNENTPTEDILKNSPDAQEEANSSSSSPEDKNEASDTAGEADKTQLPEAGAKGEKSEEQNEEEKLLQSKNPIPFERFSQFIQQRNGIKKELEEASKIIEAYHSNPNVLRAILKEQGYSDEKVSEYLREQGLEEAKKETTPGNKDVKTELKDLVKDLDLSTQEGWLEANYRIAQKIADERAEAKLSDYDKRNSVKANTEKFIADQEKTAKELCEKTYKIPYGVSGKDEGNPETAVGKISKYLDAHPEDAGLGHVKLLRLALSEEGFKQAEQKGKNEEKKRQENLKKSAVEGEETSGGGGETPTADWPVEKILEWRKKHQE